MKVRTVVLVVVVGACAPLHRLVLPRADVAGADQAKVAATLAAAGYTIKVASDTVVVTEALAGATKNSAGSKAPTLETVQVTFANGVASVQMKVDCDMRNQFMLDPTPTHPSQWEPCPHGKMWPMAEPRERYAQIVTALGGSPPSTEPPAKPPR